MAVVTHKPALRIESLKFRYHRRRRGEPWVIDIPALAMTRGEQMLLTGGSGRGKSTLLHLICGLMDPVEGETHVDGTPIHSLHGHDRDLFRGKRIGMIFQSFNLMHGFSALENVMVAMMFSSIPRREHRRRARDLLQHLGIDHPRRSPDKMSIGQQQRVAVARAVACDPVLVLADEPTASLDPDNAQIAMELIQNICQEKKSALLCVSHDPTMSERFERQASLDELAKGEIPAEAPVPLASAKVTEAEIAMLSPAQEEVPIVEASTDVADEEPVPELDLDGNVVHAAADAGEGEVEVEGDLEIETTAPADEPSRPSGAN